MDEKNYKIKKNNFGEIYKKIVKEKKSVEKKEKDANLISTFEDGYNLYKEEMVLENLTSKTTENNLKRIEVFEKWCKKKHIFTLNEVEFSNAKEYALSFINRGSKAITVNKNVTTLKKMFEAVRKVNPSLTNIFALLPRMKEDKVEIYSYNPEDIKNFFSYMLEKNSFTSYRMYILIFMALDTGMRVDEMLTLKTKNVNLNSCNIEVNKTKSRYSRSVPFSEELKSRLKDYFQVKEKMGFSNEYVFANESNLPITYESVRSYLRRMKQSLNFTDGQLDMHRFRHTFCYTFIKNGGDPFTLKKIVGHRSLVTTLNYVNLGRDKLNDAHDKFSYFSNVSK